MVDKRNTDYSSTMSSDASPQLKAPLMTAGSGGSRDDPSSETATDSITINIHNPSRRSTNWKLRYQDFLSSSRSSSTSTSAANGTEPQDNFR